MKIAIYTHPDCLKHDTGFAHPECPERLMEILNAVKTSPFAGSLEILEAPLGKDEQILLAHTREHLEYIKNSAPHHQPCLS